jgi:hypothetical protein
METVMKPDSMRAFAATFLLFSLMLFAGNIYAEIGNALVFHRTIVTIWMTILFLIPAMFLYLTGRRETTWSYWLWTFALLSYLVHFYFAYGEIHGYSVGSVYAKQGAVTATYNFIITAVWIVFTVFLWKTPNRYTIYKHIFVLLLMVGMLVSSIIIKDGVVSWLGYILVLSIIAGFAVRFIKRPSALST